MYVCVCVGGQTRWVLGGELLMALSLENMGGKKITHSAAPQIDLCYCLGALLSSHFSIHGLNTWL